MRYNITTRCSITNAVKSVKTTVRSIAPFITQSLNVRAMSLAFVGLIEYLVYWFNDTGLNRPAPHRPGPARDTRVRHVGGETACPARPTPALIYGHCGNGMAVCSPDRTHLDGPHTRRWRCETLCIRVERGLTDACGSDRLLNDTRAQIDIHR